MLQLLSVHKNQGTLSCWDVWLLLGHPWDPGTYTESRCHQGEGKTLFWKLPGLLGFPLAALYFQALPDRDALADVTITYEINRAGEERKPRQLKGTAPGHAAPRWQGWDMNPGLSPPAPGSFH